MGGILVQLNQPEQARLQFERALRIAPSYFDTRFGLAMALSRGGSFRAALDEFNQLVRLKPKDAHVRVQRAFALLNEGQVDAAIADLRASIELNPENPDAHRLLSRGHLLAKQYSLGVEAGLNYMRRAAMKVAELSDLAEAYAQLGLIEQGQEVIEQAFKRSACRPYLTVARAFGLLVRCRPTQALREFDRVLQSNPRDTGARLGRAEALLDLRREKEARVEFDKVCGSNRQSRSPPSPCSALRAFWSERMN
jgi:Tfp pilus assembly protein PilF